MPGEQQDVTFSALLMKEILENQRAMLGAIGDMVKRPELSEIIKRLDAAVSRETLDERWKRMDEKIDGLASQVSALVSNEKIAREARLPTWLSASGTASLFTVGATIIATTVLHFVFHV